MTSGGVFAAVVAAADWLKQPRDTREAIRDWKKIVQSNENTLHALIGKLERIREKQTKLQNDGCRNKHSEVDIFLRSAENIALELGRLIREINTNLWWEESQQRTDGGQINHPILAWLLPAAEMLECAFDRLWLHVHLVNVKPAQDSPALSALDTDRCMAIDEQIPDTLSDWIDLCYVPIAKATTQQRLGKSVDHRSSRNDTYTLVVERGCVGSENIDSFTGGTEAKLAKALLCGIWGFNLKSPNHLRDGSIHTGSLFNLRSHSQHAVDSLPVNAETREDVCLCFSDLLEPENSRPLFGHLLRMYSTTSWLHSARVESISRIDAILELPQAKRQGCKTPGLGSLGTIEEMIDCSAWLIDQSSQKLEPCDFAEISQVPALSDAETHPAQYGNRLESFWTRQLLESGPGRHFALRAAYCVLAGVRPLSGAELFAAATTKLHPDDYDWPGALSDSTRRVGSLLELCSPFLTTTKNGRVKMRSESLIRCFLQNEASAPVEAEIFLAHVCLSKLDEMGLRTVIWPWSRYNKLRVRAEHHPLHVYVSSCWQHHYQKAEPHSTDLPKLLHRMIESAWLAERTQSYSTNATEDEVDLDAYDEALEVGLIICRAFKFKELASAYVNMGARVPVISSASTTENNALAPDASKHPIDKNKSDRLVGSGPVYQSSRDESFDFSDWQHVEPFNSL